MDHAQMELSADKSKNGAMTNVSNWLLRLSITLMIPFLLMIAARFTAGVITSRIGTLYCFCRVGKAVLAAELQAMTISLARCSSRKSVSLIEYFFIVSELLDPYGVRAISPK